MPAKTRVGTAQMRLCPPYAPSARPCEILRDAWFAGVETESAAARYMVLGNKR